jgi:hypothetical protein
MGYRLPQPLKDFLADPQVRSSCDMLIEERK